MNQIKTLEKLKGKIIERVADDEGGCLVTFYTDKTYSVFYSKRGYECDYGIMEEDYSLAPNIENCVDLFKIGVISEVQCDQVVLNNELEKIAKKENNERQQYEQLKLKFDKE